MIKTPALSLLVTFVTAHAAAQVDWIPQIDLAPRVGHAMAFDPLLKQVLMFGGGVGRDDFWAWDGSKWTELRPALKPPGRARHAMTYDTTRRRLVVFGGQDAAGRYLDDTWEWDGVTWTQVVPATRPPGRGDARMAFDSGRGRVVLFGGMVLANYQGAFYDDLWEWDGRNWTRVITPSGPAARAEHTMVFDPARNRVVMHGGWNSSPGRLDDTWEFNGTAWTARLTATQPALQRGAAAWFDPVSGRTMLFGLHVAIRTQDPTRQETWALDATDWRLVPAIAPTAHPFVSLAHDPIRGRTVVFGGGASGGDTLEYDGQSWTVVNASQAPTLGFGMTGALAYDSNRAVTVLALSPGIETWENNGTSWTRRSGVGGPVITNGHAIAFDSARSRVVLFGGNSPYGNDQTWEYDGVAWTRMQPATRPPALHDPALVYDPVRAQLVLFGASGNSNPSQTWAWNGTNWTNMTPATAPWGRTNARAVWHAGRGTIVAYGGGDPAVTNAIFGDLWEWNGRSWIQLATWIPPGTRSGHRIGYDPARDRLVVYGGRRMNTWLTDTWEWDQSTWVQRTSAQDPGMTAVSDMAFDSARNRLLLFGGESSSTWTCGPDFPASVESFGAGCAGSAGTPILAPDAQGLPWLGSNFRQVLTNAPARAPVFLEFGISDKLWAGNTLPLDLTVIGMPGCSLLTSPDVPLPLTADANGIARHTFPMPSLATLLGARVYTQAFVIDAAANTLGGTTSNALAAQVGGK